MARFILSGVLILSIALAPLPSVAQEPPPDAGADACNFDLLSRGPFDAAMARQLGADEYGMRRYVLAFLYAGPNRTQPEEEAARLQKAHLDNINRLGELGKLVVAGPFMDGGELRGIYIFAVDSVEEARALTESDPAIQAGRLKMELHPWYGSAALAAVNGLHKRISPTHP